MELRNNPNIYFSPEAHIYLMGDKELMGVTSLMQKHGLSPDYSDIPEAVLRKAADEGTRLHKIIEDYDNGETMLTSEFLDEYKQICRESGLIFVCNELLISDEEIVASMIDGVYKGSKPDTFILVDYKSTQKVHWRSLSWQLSIYKVLFERQFPGAKVEALKVLHLDKKRDKVLGLYPVEEIPEAEVDALLLAEKEGRIYVDENDVPSADLVLPEQELAAYVANATKIAELKAVIKDLEEAMKAQDEKIRIYMEDNNIETMSAPGGEFKLKKSYTQERVDSKKLKEKWPSIWEAVSKTVTVKGSVSFKNK